MLGRRVVRAALERGHDVTCAARGTSPVPDGAKLIRLDRDRDDGLLPLSGGDEEWDTIVDVTRQPGHARRAVRDLRARHWVFVSSGNVYARFDRPEQAENADLVAPLVDDVLHDMGAYGQAKVACESAFQGARRPDGTDAPLLIVRAGLIGGDGDWSGRSGYYPWRFAHPSGDDVLVPPDPDFPVAMIDVEDLAAWIVESAERRLNGVFNATGDTHTLAQFLDVARRVADSRAVARHVDAAALASAGIGAWMGTPSLPLWIDDADWRWFATLNTAAARAAGLRTRPLADTLAAALEYENRRDVPRATGLTDEQEHALRRRLAGSPSM